MRGFIRACRPGIALGTVLSVLALPIIGERAQAQPPVGEISMSGTKPRRAAAGVVSLMWPGQTATTSSAGDPSPEGTPAPSSEEEEDGRLEPILLLIGAVGGAAVSVATVVEKLRRPKPAERHAASGVVLSLDAPEPSGWARHKFPEDWQSEDVRRAFWKNQRRRYWALSLIASVILLAGAIAFVTDV
jgi:hypothetical protein